MKILSILMFLTICTSTSFAEMKAISDEELHAVSGQSGITINAKIKLGDESRFVYTNTKGKTKAQAEIDNDLSYVIVDKISGSIEVKGLKMDLIKDLNSSGKSAIQWTLPKEVITDKFKIGGIYASTKDKVYPSGHADENKSSFLVGLEMDGKLSLPVSTTVSVFVVD